MSDEEPVAHDGDLSEEAKTMDNGTTCVNTIPVAMAAMTSPLLLCFLC